MQLYKKKTTPTQMFSCEYCGIFKDSFFHRTPLAAASNYKVVWKIFDLWHCWIKLGRNEKVFENDYCVFMSSLLLKNKIQFLNCCLYNRILKQTCQVKIQRLAMNLFFQGQIKTATRNKIISARLVILFIQHLLQKSRPLFFKKESMATFIVMIQCVKVVESVQRDILLLMQYVPHAQLFFFFFFFTVSLATVF